MSEKESDEGKTGVPQIEVTPEMIQAGVRALEPFVMPDGVLAAFAVRSAIEAVLFAAIHTHRQSCPRAPSIAD